MRVDPIGALKKHLEEEAARLTQDRLQHGTIFNPGVKRSGSNSEVADVLEDEGQDKEVTSSDHTDYRRLQREHEQLQESTSIALEKKTMEIQRLSEENFVSPAKYDSASFCTSEPSKPEK